MSKAATQKIIASITSGKVCTSKWLNDIDFAHIFSNDLSVLFAQGLEVAFVAASQPTR